MGGLPACARLPEEPHCGQGAGLGPARETTRLGVGQGSHQSPRDTIMGMMATAGVREA